MNDTVIIAHPSTYSTRSISAQVATVSDKLVILETSATEDMELLYKEYGWALLIIDASLFQTDSRLSYLPQDTAILILLEAEQVEDYLENITLLISSTIDFLLKHHVQILPKQRTATLELFLCRYTINTLSKELTSSKQSLQAQQRYLDILSERNELTGLYNRKHLTAILRQEFQSGRRYNTDLSLLPLDIDNFKEINQCCSTKAFDNGQNTQKITISIGIASLCDSQPDSPNQFVNMADRAMYQAKAKG